MNTLSIRIGCAGWSIPKLYADFFPSKGSHLERYSQRFPVVEINSSFYKPHKSATYARWSNIVPDHFQFSVKVPKQISHVARLTDLSGLDAFLEGPMSLGNKLGPLLVQLPPKLAFDRAVSSGFFSALRSRFSGSVVCEPRHESWFQSEADRLLRTFHIARVAADPSPFPKGSEPGGWKGLFYYRLHGPPRKYYSKYSEDFLKDLARRLKADADSTQTWVIFDNTASGAATLNALTLLDLVKS